MYIHVHTTCVHVCSCTCRATKAKLQRLERELKELEKTKESLRHSQAKFAELEKTTKKLNKQSHLDKKEIIRLKEEIELYKTKVHVSSTLGTI